MKLPTTDEEIAAWVTAKLRALDTTPRDKMWRKKALGMPRTVALASAPREYRLDIRIPVGEMRVLNDVAKSRGIGTRTYLRSSLATVMVACDGVSPDLIPWFTGDGLIGPR